MTLLLEYDRVVSAPIKEDSSVPLLCNSHVTQYLRVAGMGHPVQQQQQSHYSALHLAQMRMMKCDI